MECTNWGRYSNSIALASLNYKVLEGLKRKAEDPDFTSIDVVNLKDVFEFVDNSFAELHNKKSLPCFLSILHFAVQIESETSSGQAKVADFLLLLLRKYKNSEEDFKLVLQILYQLLNSLNHQSNTDLADKLDVLFLELCDSLFNSSKLVAANILTCLQLQVKMFQRGDLFQLLWQRVLEVRQHTSCNHRDAEILVYIIDDLLHHIPDFYRNEEFVRIVQSLLVSVSREERKSAIYLMRKIIPLIVQRAKDASDWESIDIEALNYSWASYISVLENLEEKQSHLIMPALSTIETIKLKESWMCLLYSQLLRHNNNLVVRWTIERILDSFKCVDLNEKVLKSFLEATNNTSLYDKDNFCIPYKALRRFLSCDLSLFFKHFGDINWKPVPLFVWLDNVTLEETDKISNKTLLEIASRVRSLQNKQIRGETISNFEEAFKTRIETLNIAEYLRLIETLYNPSDSYDKVGLLVKKLTEYRTMLEDVVFTQRLYEILEGSDWEPSEQSDTLKLFEDLSSENHGALRFLFLFYFEKNDEKINFCRRKYGIDLDQVKSFSSFLTMLDKIVVDEIVTECEESFAHEKAVDYFVCNYVKSYNGDFEEEIEGFIDNGGQGTIMSLSNLLAASEIQVDSEVLNILLPKLGKYSKDVDFCEKICNNLLEYFHKHLSDDLSSEYVTKILQTINGYAPYKALFSSKLKYKKFEEIINGLYCVDSVYGDARIERRYETLLNHSTIRELSDVIQNLDQICPEGDRRIERGASHEEPVELWSGLKDLLSEEIENPFKLRKSAIDYIISSSDEVVLDLLKYLIKMNADISKKKPRYFENSYEHRLKLRIAIGILQVFGTTGKKYWLDDYWQVILTQNNQLNVTILYERIIVYNASSIDVFMEYLNEVSKYAPSQQISIIIMCFNYCCLNWDHIEHSDKENVFIKLLPLTMGANFQIRRNSQKALYNMCGMDILRETKVLSRYHPLIDAIISTNGTKIIDFDIRFKSVTDTVADDAADTAADALVERDINSILFATNAPDDECDPNYMYKSDADRGKNLLKSRELFRGKQKTVQNAQSDYEERDARTATLNVQRKKNPQTDIMLSSDLFSYPDCQLQKGAESDMIVVASLVEKLSNLGGIARTCEVLGIKNLVMNSKTNTLKDEFKNLSMTAEKGLIINEVKRDSLREFLVQKQSKGYEIVGAEQTTNSRSFVDFKFPKKCILLLGHEKEGIPAPLLLLLNHTVEIPQFGVVRSLNVHVTGGIFMWEYCKQHMV